MTKNQDHKTYLTKIQKLLALAESSNEHEAESARMFAQRIMDRHGITQDELDAASSLVTKRLILERNGLARYEMELATIVAYFNDCVTVFHEHPEPEMIYVVGSKKATKEAEEQFLWLFHEINSAAVMSARRFSRTFGFYWKRSFWAGALDALDQRLEKMNEVEEESLEEDEGLNWLKRFVNKFKGKVRPKDPDQETALVKREESEFDKAEGWAKDELQVDYKELPEEAEGSKIVDGLAYKAGLYTGENIELDPDERKALIESTVNGG